MAKRILLDEEDFTKLIKGKIIKKDDVDIALQDIGYVNMINIIEKAYQDLLKQERY